MNQRWTVEEEGKLLKLIASGKTCKELSGTTYDFNRSENALELRLKKVIYDNIMNKKPADKIAQLLNMPREKIMQYFYSYKDYIDKQKQIGVDDNNIISHKSDKINNIQKLSNINTSIKQNQNAFIKQNQNGGTNINLDNIEKQNKKMKLLLENYILKQKLSKLLKNKHNNLQKDALNALIKN
jgi:hypothetical protein